MVNKENFGKRLEKIMEHYNMTATNLADEVGFNRSSISHLLSGRNKPSLEFVMKLLEKFPELTLEWLVNGKGSFMPSDEKPAPSPPNTSGKTADLFSQMEEEPRSTYGSRPAVKSNDTVDDKGKVIERIVIFYSDGTFRAYHK